MAKQPYPNSQTEPESRLARLQAWIRRLLRKQREEQFSREEQLSMVLLAHAVILGGVTFIMRVVFGHGLSRFPPIGFWTCELAILVMCYVVTFTRTGPFITGIEKLVMSVGPIKRLINTHGAVIKGRIQATTLLLVYALQFAALISLLVATGGPIDSPFAQMALAIAVFTPFIVNKWWTIGLIVLTTIVYYAVFVAFFGFEDSKAIRPTPFSFIAVNLLILGLASFMTFRRRDSRTITVSHIFNVPREQVWKAWTNPDSVAQWFGLDSIPSEVELDVKTGGAWRASMRHRDGRSELPWNGIYHEVEPPERLVFTLSSRPDQGHDLVTVVLTEDDGKTEMTVQQSDAGRYSGLEEGWSAFFDRMADSLSRP